MHTPGEDAIDEAIADVDMMAGELNGRERSSLAGSHPALEWLSLRRDGESVALIAHRAGVSVAAVARATDPFGPFPRPSRQLGRVIVDEAAVTARTKRWMRMRQDGVGVMDIAASEQVAHQVVSKATVLFGPYPRPRRRLDEGALEQWVHDRHAGIPVATIAAVAGVSAAKVRRVTQPHGPFPSAGHRLPQGVVGVSGLARLLGVSAPTITRWRTTGFLPQPDIVTKTDRVLWHEATIGAWRQTTPLSVCPTCGRVSKRLSAHTSQGKCGRRV